MGGVGSLIAVAAAGDGDADGRLVRLHVANLHGGGVGAQEGVRGCAVVISHARLRLQPERVPHIAGGVVGGDAEAPEVVFVEFDLGAFDGVEAHAGEGGEDRAEGDGDGVQAASGLRAAWEGHVDGPGGDGGGERDGTEVVAAGGEGGLEFIAEGVGGGAGGAALVRVEAAEGAEDAGECAGAAEGGGAPSIEGGFVGGGGESGSGLGGDGGDGVSGHGWSVRVAGLTPNPSPGGEGSKNRGACVRWPRLWFDKLTTSGEWGSWWGSEGLRNHLHPSHLVPPQAGGAEAAEVSQPQSHGRMRTCWYR